MAISIFDKKEVIPNGNNLEIALKNSYSTLTHLIDYLEHIMGH